MSDEEYDEWMPRERGLLGGEAWAREMREQGAIASTEDGQAIDPVLAAAQDTPHIAASVRDEIMDAGMRERLSASEDPDAESAFWAGFRDGVRAYLVRVKIGTTSN